ncbi:universal stress protein [soil metagenome]
MSEVMVGVGGGQSSHSAVEWAASRTARTSGSVHLVHVIDVTWGIVPAEYTEQAILAAEQSLREVERSVADRYPDVAVRSSVLVGSPVEELARATEQADLLVVGTRRRGEFGGAGRLATRIAARAACSVIVVPDDVPADATGVIVGVDGSDDSDAAVKFAAREADRLGESLTVIYSWAAPEPWDTTESILAPLAPLDEDRIVIAEAIAGLAEDYPDLTVHSEVVSARPERALYGASVRARMLVVGSRGRHGLTKLFLGSVSESMVSLLPCAVAVIRPGTFGPVSASDVDAR